MHAFWKTIRLLPGWAPGLSTLLNYQSAWLLRDLVAGLALTAILVPVGMGYAEASGLPAIHGLYATLIPLIVYAIFGPSRILVLGPDSTLTAVIAALILPLAAGSVERAVLLAGMLAILSGVCSMLIGLARLGLLADLLSKPIRIGFLNAIALTVLAGQLPKILGIPATAGGLFDQLAHLLQNLASGQSNLVALLTGCTSLALILLLARSRPRWPGLLLVVVLATGVSAWFDLADTAHLSVLGRLPQGLPHWQFPLVSWHDVLQLLPGAIMISLLSFTDTSVLSRALAQRGGYRVSQSQEMVALGLANIATGLAQGFAISSSASRTPVAEAAGAKTQVTGLVGALAIALLLVWGTGWLQSLPNAVLGAVVIAACLSFADVAGMRQMYRQRKVEFALSLTSFVGVALIGVIEGIFITLAMTMLVLLWNAWHPYFAVLARVDRTKGYHDITRHPEGRRVPGLVLFRWDAQLFFANGEIFQEQVQRAIATALTPTRRLVVVADAITDIDITAADMLASLYLDLKQQGIELWFAGLKGQVKDRLKNYGTLDLIGHDIFAPTVGNAVNLYRTHHAVDWKDWDEV
ncbi:SulP family inorganic anion transporter [Rhodoferax sp.]|uniref:SulP family inorganic anion transporter n=1 Tax=Rhodoferax sp. TaxID=50421 RepID=UPI002631F093|nr:SulP family inorganic anion transporter [Rhodoferax sp.]MDD3935448.1 SulP family inorganic anion transporter [Rhodoferax sp.]